VVIQFSFCAANKPITRQTAVEHLVRHQVMKESGGRHMRKVKYEEMLPQEFEEALRQFPVAYVPVGSLEWHGRHLALGNDTLKSNGILLRTAEKYGGIVVPPTFWGHMGHWKLGCHPGLPPEIVDGLFTAVFQGLVTVGFKVGHRRHWT
jgi:creatinine amidohydrolase/Fe(II)-dependent formamide hydrolase-like protein